jgi:hypothetical protein
MRCGFLGFNFVEDEELRADALMEASSSSSSSFSCWLKVKARRNRPLRPPLRIILALGVDSSMVARSLSSRDIRFSDAVKLPCDKGDGRAGRGVVEEEAEEGEVVVGDNEAGESVGGPLERLDDGVELALEEEEEFR